MSKSTKKLNPTVPPIKVIKQLTRVIKSLAKTSELLRSMGIRNDALETAYDELSNARTEMVDIEVARVKELLSKQ